MSIPSYIQQLNVFFNGVLTPCAVLVDGDPKLAIRFDALDYAGKEHLEALFQFNNAQFPLADIEQARDLVLNNGSTWLDMYGQSLIPVYSKLQYSGAGSLSYVVYHDGNQWKNINTDQPEAN